MARFVGELTSSGRGSGGHLVEVPEDVVQALGGGGRIAVRATFNGIPYRGSVVRMGGLTCIGVTKAVMAEAGLGVGDRVDVVVGRDDAQREVDVPDDLAAAIRKADLGEAWDRMSYSHRKEYSRSVAEAKRPETRQRRIDRALTELQKRAET